MHKVRKHVPTCSYSIEKTPRSRGRGGNDTRLDARLSEFEQIPGKGARLNDTVCRRKRSFQSWKALRALFHIPSVLSCGFYEKLDLEEKRKHERVRKSSQLSRWERAGGPAPRQVWRERIVPRTLSALHLGGLAGPEGSSMQKDGDAEPKGVRCPLPPGILSAYTGYEDRRVDPHNPS